MNDKPYLSQICLGEKTSMETVGSSAWALCAMHSQSPEHNVKEHDVTFDIHLMHVCAKSALHIFSVYGVLLA